MRGISDKFIEDLKTGTLVEVLNTVKVDHTLCLEIRENYINIYYRGGNALKITEKSEGIYEFWFDVKYVADDTVKQRIDSLLSGSVSTNNMSTKKWIEQLPHIKNQMDIWFGQHPKEEREYQQLVAYENNYGSGANSTDYYICDIEYANEDRRFDMIAVKWPSITSDRKNNRNLRLSFIEMKYLDNIDRLVQMYKAARHTKRLFIMDIFTAHIVSQLGSSIPNPRTFKDIRVFYPFYLTRRMFSKSNSSKIMRKFSRYRISAEELSNRKDYCMLIRDSMLFDLDKRIRNIEDAGLIYSMWNGYIKSARMQRLMNFVGSKNMEVIYLHTSGHADVETVKRISRACRPQLIIPVHTEHPERFREIFNNAIIINDRQLLSI